MRMEPIAAIGRGGDEADWLVILPVNLIALAVLPGRHPDRPRPGIGVALAFDADQYRRGHVRVGLRITAGNVLTDKPIEHVACHIRFHPLVSRRAAVIE